MKKQRYTSGVLRSTPPLTDEAQPDFFQRLQQLTPQDWETGHKVYGYRLWPIIDRKDEAHFLFKTSEAIDEDYVLRHFGSGKYSLRLNDRRGETVASKIIAIHNPDFPPRVSPDEVVHADPRNETYFKVWGPRQTESAGSADSAAVGELAKLAGKVLDQKTPAPVPANGLAEATTALVLGMSKGRDELAEKLAKVASETDSLASLDRAVELLQKLNPSSSTADPISALDRAVDLLKKLQPPARPSSEKNPIEQVSEMLDLLGKLKQNFVPSVGTDNAGVDLRSIAAIVREVAELLKNPLTIAMQAWAASRSGTPPAPQQPIATAPGRLPQSAPPHATTPTQPPAAQPESQTTSKPAQPDVSTVPPPQDSVIALANAITPVMLRWLHHDAPGAELGEEFAAWVADGYGGVELRALQRIGTDTILQLYQ